MKTDNQTHFLAFAAGMLTPVVILIVTMLLCFAFVGFYPYPVISVASSRPQPTVLERAPTTNLPTRLVEAPNGQVQQAQPLNNDRLNAMATLYQQLNPGVVNIQVYGEEEGVISEKVGAGFILDEKGHIVTNYHVVAGVEQVIVIFYNEFETEAKIIGSDDVSDLAVIKVEKLVEGTYPLLLGDSDAVNVGEWVIAIGNPLGQQNSMSVGIVSGMGRTIASPTPDFVIPGVIQTDADMNLGSSGGPLLNLQGEVIGLNTQIAITSLTPGPGLGFAIPINLVQRVASVLIERGAYQWPWLGAQGGKVNLALMQANHLESQQGAYIDVVIPNSPAAEAGLQGTTGTEEINGLSVSIGGDVVISADGHPLANFNDLLIHLIDQELGDEIELIVLRNGQPQQVMVKLASRTAEFIP
jgi:2-alkenal reductase